MADGAYIPKPASPAWRRWGRAFIHWFDTGPHVVPKDGEPLPDIPDRVEWARILPFVGMHLACFAVIWVGWSPVAVGVAVSAYLVRMFAITGFYHRYFSHRSFKTSRVGQFIFGVLGASAVQRGPVWWAAHHRHHHAYSDKPEDVHSPVQRGFILSHMGWFLTARGFRPDLRRVRDLLQFPELRWLDRFDILVPVALAVGMFGLGALLARVAPELGTSAGQMLVWGFFVSTVACYHGTYTINSLSREPPLTVRQVGRSSTFRKPWRSKKSTKKRAGNSSMPRPVADQMARPMGRM